MAITGTLMYQNDATNLPVGTAKGWKVGFGYTTKGTVVAVYVVSASGVTTSATEIPLLGNGKADTNAVSSYLASFGVTLVQAVKNVIGA